MKKFMAVLALGLGLVTSCGQGPKGKKQAASTQAAEDSVAAVQREIKVNEKIAALPAEPEFDIITTLGTIRVKLTLRSTEKILPDWHLKVTMMVCSFIG